MDLKTMTYDEMLAKRLKNEKRLDEITDKIESLKDQLKNSNAGKVAAYDPIIHNMVVGSEITQASKLALTDSINEQNVDLHIEYYELTNENKQLDKEIKKIELSSEAMQNKLIENMSLNELNKEIKKLDKKIINIDETKRRFDPYTRNEMEKDRERMATRNDKLKVVAYDKERLLEKLIKERDQIKAEIKKENPIDKRRISDLNKDIKQKESELNREERKRKGLSQGEREALGESTQGIRVEKDGLETQRAALYAKLEGRKEALKNVNDQISELKKGPKKTSKTQKSAQVGRA